MSRLPACLINDMMIYYAPSILYKEEVSVMEMICASVCITSMISFTLEKKYRGSRSMDQTHNANKHRMAARGNLRAQAKHTDAPVFLCERCVLYCNIHLLSIE